MIFVSGLTSDGEVWLGPVSVQDIWSGLVLVEDVNAQTKDNHLVAT